MRPSHYHDHHHRPRFGALPINSRNFAGARSLSLSFPKIPIECYAHGKNVKETSTFSTAIGIHNLKSFKKFEKKMNLLPKSVKNSLLLINNTHLVPDDTYKTLLESCTKELLDMHTTNLKSLNSNKPDVMKEVHCALMKTLVYFARADVDEERATAVLREIKVDEEKTKLFVQTYERNKMGLQMKLGCIGLHSPHIVDVDWRIDYTIKSNTSDQSVGPLFRLHFIVDHPVDKGVRFTCTAQQLQDLLYSLKDAVTHCGKIASCND